jgi:hypothetical protein
MQDARAMPRSNMFIAGMLYWGKSSAPARIRNMSTSGALVEAPALPPAGTSVRVARGSLDAHGVVAWVGTGRCGIRFTSQVAVREWLTPPRNCRQPLVDQMVLAVKLGADLPSAGRQPPADHVAEASITLQLASDLREAAVLLDLLSADLAGDPALLRQHAPSLQNLDIAGQTLNAVIAALTSSPLDSAELEARLGSLRCSRASLIHK